MTLGLQKGNLLINKTVPTINRVLISMNWDTRSLNGSGFDLDVAA